MSVDRSIKVNASLLKRRSVLTRAERIDQLRRERRWSDGDAVLGLPKVRTLMKGKAKKKKKEEDTAEAEAAATE